MSRLYRYFVAASWQTVDGNHGMSDAVMSLTGPAQSGDDLEPIRSMVKEQMEAKYGVELAWVRLTAVNYLPSAEDLSQ